jgi:hypothetical protein
MSNTVKIDFVGGPAHGEKIDRPNVSTVNVPVIGTGGFGQFQYTLRRCKNRYGRIVEVLAPAGRNLDPNWLKQNDLTN